MPTRINGQDLRTVVYNSLSAAMLGDWIYGNSGLNGFPEFAPPLNEKVRATIWIQNKQTDTEGAALVTEDKIYLIFRGTESLTEGGLRDWTNNLKAHGGAKKDVLQAIKSDGPIVERLGKLITALSDNSTKADFCGIEAHPGFVEATESVLDQVRDVLDLYRGVKEIVFIGHSLGGAVAVLMAVAFTRLFRQIDDRRDISIYTLGQPRVSKRRQINLALIGIPYYRIQNGADIVPGIPRLGYSHGGTNIYIRRSALKAKKAGQAVGKHISINPSALVKFLDRAGAGLDRIKDHSTKLYIKYLARATK